MLLWWIEGPESLYAGLIGITAEEQLARAEKGIAQSNKESISMDIAVQITKFIGYKALQWEMENKGYGECDHDLLEDEMDACLEMIMDDWNTLQALEAQ